MKLLTFYTDSHKGLYEKYFLTSYNKYLKDSFELLNKHVHQHSISGDYGSDGFSETMVEKIDFIIDYIDITDDSIMVFADCDVQFFGDFSEDIINQLGDFDIKFQNDVICRCAGFLVCKQNEKVLNFFNNIKSILLKNIKPGTDDQVIINYALDQNLFPNLKHGLLSEKYFTVALSTGPKQWIGEEFIVPNGIYVHHGNWTLGMDNKVKLMDYVKDKINDNKQ